MKSKYIHTAPHAYAIAARRTCTRGECTQSGLMYSSCHRDHSEPIEGVYAYSIYPREQPSSASSRLKHRRFVHLLAFTNSCCIGLPSLCITTDHFCSVPSPPPLHQLSWKSGKHSFTIRLLKVCYNRLHPCCSRNRLMLFPSPLPTHSTYCPHSASSNLTQFEQAQV